MEWSYGITTIAAREHSLFARTKSSLHCAGFQDPVVLVDEELKGQTSALRNWQTLLVHLYLKKPNAERYAIFEDDLLACSNLKIYLSQCEYPKLGYLNLLTHDQNMCLTGNVPGWHKSNQRGRGAVGLVFDNKTLTTLFRTVEFWKRPKKKNRQCPDGMVVECLREHKMKEYIHYPSLLQHEGSVSALGHKYGKVHGFKGEDYDPMTLLHHDKNGAAYHRESSSV